MHLYSLGVNLISSVDYLKFRFISSALKCLMESDWLHYTSSCLLTVVRACSEVFWFNSTIVTFYEYSEVKKNVRSLIAAFALD